jgi:DnaK suppressor protein
MDSKTLEHFKNLFLEMKRNDALKELALQTDALGWDDQGDEVDQTLKERDEMLGRKLHGRHSFYLRKVDNALEKIENGNFGTCVECDEEISLSRLYARPTATECITCKEELEREETNIRYDKKSHTHGYTFINSNVIPLPNKEKANENVLKFNRGKLGESLRV